MNIKKYLPVVCLLAFFVVLLMPDLVGAQGYFENIGLTFDGPFADGTRLMGVVALIIQIAFALAGLVATFYLILGGYNYITAGGNPEAIEGAKATITNAIIGMIVILISYLLVDFLLARLGATNIDLPNQ